jgi:hypothetical protein
MASVDYAGVAETWLHQESRGALSCGTACRGQVIEVPQPDGSARVSVILEAKNAMAWADKERPNLRMGTPADVVLRGKVPTLGSTKLELEFSIPEAGAPLPDLMQLIYDPAPGQVLHRLRFHGQAEGVLRGKATLMEIVQTGISPTLPSSSMTDGLPAEITFTKLVNRIR